MNDKTSKDTKTEKTKEEIFAMLIRSIVNINSDKECAHAAGIIAQNITKSDTPNKALLIKRLIATARCITDDFYIADFIKDISSEIKNLKTEEKYEVFEYVLAYEKSIYTDEDRCDSLKNISEQIVRNEDIPDKLKAILFNKILDRTENIRSDKHRAYSIGKISEFIVEMRINEKQKAYKTYLIDKAIDIIRNLEHSCKPEPYGKVLRAMLKSNAGNIKLFDKIVNSIKSIVSSKIKTEIVRQIIKQLESVSNDESVHFDKQLVILRLIDTVEDVQSDKSKAELYTDIIEELYHMKDDENASSVFLLDKLIKHAQLIDNSYYKSITFEGIIRILAKKGHHEKALTLLKHVEDDKNLMLALVDISKELVKED